MVARDHGREDDMGGRVIEVVVARHGGTGPDGCARAVGDAGEPAVPLLRDATGPVACLRCGSGFGGGAEAGTVCPYCGGALVETTPIGGGA